MLLCSAVLSMGLAACSLTESEKPKVVLVKPEIPESAKHCRDVQVPKDMKTQKDVASFLPTLAAGYIDCRDKLGTVVDLATK